MNSTLHAHNAAPQIDGGIDVESGSLFETIFDGSPAGLILIRKAGEIGQINGSACRIFDYREGDIEGRHISALFPSLQSATLAELRAIFVKRQQVNGTDSIDINGARGDGKALPAELTANWLGGEAPTLCVLAVRDNSTGNEAIKKHQKLQHSLEFQVRIRTSELAEKVRERDIAHKKLREALEELQRTQSTLIEQERMASLGNLVAGVAHEINTPVGIGVTAASHLRESATEFATRYRDGDMTRGTLEKFVQTCTQSTEILESNLHRASDLIRSFKQVAVDQSDDCVREISLMEYVSEVILSLRPKLKNTSINVAVDISPEHMLTTNPGSISQIISNLVMNSLIHGYDQPETGAITISSRIDGDMISVIYQDDGKGMDEETARQVFEPFFTTRRGSGGSGLGMHILYNLVTQSLGGSVSCDTAPGDGVRITITFPHSTIQQQEV